MKYKCKLKHVQGNIYIHKQMNVELIRLTSLGAEDFTNTGDTF